jgi:hypothetical protein
MKNQLNLFWRLDPHGKAIFGLRAERVIEQL